MDSDNCGCLRKLKITKCTQNTGRPPLVRHESRGGHIPYPEAVCGGRIEVNTSMYASSAISIGIRSVIVLGGLEASMTRLQVKKEGSHRENAKSIGLG